MTRRELVTTSAALLAAALIAACSSSTSPEPAQSPRPPGPPGATIIPGGPMDQIPVPSSPKIPASQQEAQDTVLRYLQQTVDALPKGTSLDGTRYGLIGTTSYCEDDPADAGAPVHYADWRDMKLPPGVDVTAIIGQTGDIWKQWGWQVIERDGFEKPNRFGYSPDGYVLQIQARPDPKYPPSLIGSSPCYPGDLRRDIPRPPVIEQAP